MTEQEKVSSGEILRTLRRIEDVVEAVRADQLEQREDVAALRERVVTLERDSKEWRIQRRRAADIFPTAMRQQAGFWMGLTAGAAEAWHWFKGGSH